MDPACRGRKNTDFVTRTLGARIATMPDPAETDEGRSSSNNIDTVLISDTWVSEVLVFV